MKFHKKPVVIDAMQWTGDNIQEVVDFLGGRDIEGGSFFGWDPADPSGRSVVFINTLEGVMRCPVGHWVIRGVRGEHYACEPSIFEATYEPVDGMAWVEPIDEAS